MTLQAFWFVVGFSVIGYATGIMLGVVTYRGKRPSRKLWENNQLWFKRCSDLSDDRSYFARLVGIKNAEIARLKKQIPAELEAADLLAKGM